MRALVTAHAQPRRQDAKIELLDAAYWVKGCSSLGRLRYAVLVGRPRTRNARSAKSASSTSRKRRRPRRRARRMRRCRATTPSAWSKARASRAQSGRADAGGAADGSLRGGARTDAAGPEAGNRAADDGRSGQRRALSRGRGGARACAADDGSDRRAWHKAFAQSRSKTLDAPSWLWTSVVDLVATHEAAYLEHCRRYPLAEAA